ncbi:BA75_03987T0 [Komagataella pastoris]|uniref:SUN-like protein 1 n=1 Tax=Komagataella pastoris TaxID=4922 RepID=A0A1B2JF88_PICPA|nr:BA75_03987T0 [Komagataella pastoris]
MLVAWFLLLFVSCCICNDDKLNDSNPLKEAEQEEDSRFMSFEEWKKKKIDNTRNDKVLQDEQTRHNVYRESDRSYRNNELNGVLGEDMEIDLEMFTGADKDDEIGKVYQQRFNYASFDCAATIVKTNTEAKGASSILNENKDSYLLNKCDVANQYAVVELCQDILVDTVVLANYEFFSSGFKTVRFSVSDRFPVPANGWKVLGDFDASNTRSIQTFNIESPLIWARYLKIEILSHYGNEYYCPLSLVRVHGKTMMEKFKLEEVEEEEEEKANTDKGQTANIATQFKATAANQTSVQNKFLPHNGSNVTASCKNSSETNCDSESAQIKALKDEDEEDCPVSFKHFSLDEFLNEHSKEICLEKDGQSSDHISIEAPSSSSEPKTQESIYKNIIKRISLLESNATLSLLYIEEQSRLLSNAFSKLEERQSLRFEAMLDSVNNSIQNQIQLIDDLKLYFKVEFETLLAGSKAKHERALVENIELISSISDDLLFLKKLIFFTIFAGLCLFAFVISNRETYIEPTYEDDHLEYIKDRNRYRDRSGDESSVLGSPEPQPISRSLTPDTSSPLTPLPGPQLAPIPIHLTNRKKATSFERNSKSHTELIYKKTATNSYEVGSQTERPSESEPEVSPEPNTGEYTDNEADDVFSNPSKHEPSEATSSI